MGLKLAGYHFCMIQQNLEAKIRNSKTYHGNLNKTDTLTQYLNDIFLLNYSVDFTARTFQNATH